MIVSCANVKGGVGKTTLSLNLCIALSMSRRERDRQVLLIDGDQQATALSFIQLRAERRGGEIDFAAIALYGASIRTQVRSQLAAKYSHIVIDVGGRDSGSLRAALTVSDLVLIPSPPRSFDLWGVEQTADLVREARELNTGLRAVAVINAADHRGQDNIQAGEYLASVEGIEVSPFSLRRWKSYSNAAAKGLGILETADAAGEAARSEFSQLFNSLFKKDKKHDLEKA
jgi:chromosome partitioning protein